MTDRVTVKALRPSETLRAALRELAGARDVDFVAVETAAPGPQVVVVKTPCGEERLTGDVTRAQIEAAIEKCELKHAELQPGPEISRNMKPRPNPATPPETP